MVDLAAEDFDRLRRQIAKQWGPLRLGNEIERVRSLFKFGFEAGVIEQPVRYGATFREALSQGAPPGTGEGKGPRMLEAADLRRVIDKAGVPLKAMILLGLNCGFGNADVASLPEGPGLEGRPGRLSTAEDWRAPACPLWPETVAALQDALAKRPKPHERAHDALVFLTKFKRPWRCCEFKEDTRMVTVPRMVTVAKKAPMRKMARRS